MTTYNRHVLKAFASSMQMAPLEELVSEGIVPSSQVLVRPLCVRVRVYVYVGVSIASAYLSYHECMHMHVCTFFVCVRVCMCLCVLCERMRAHVY